MLEWAQPYWFLAALCLPLMAYYAVRFHGQPRGQLRGQPRGQRKGQRSRELRFYLVAALRIVAVAALIVAMAGPLRPDNSSRTDVLFALDVSRSVALDAIDRALVFINQAIAAKPAQTRIGVVVFAAQASVEVPANRAPGTLEEIRSHVRREATDIARGLTVALSAFPVAGHRRIVLLSDGRETSGNALAAAATARAIGVEVFTMPLAVSRERRDVRMRGVGVPASVASHEPFSVRIEVAANTAGAARLVLLRDGEPLSERTVQLAPGTNQFTVIDQIEDAGLTEYEALVIMAGDPTPQNNRFQAFVQVRGAPRVLHALGESGAGAALTQALRLQGLDVEEVPASAVPGTYHGLADYGLIVLNNVSGFDLSLAKMRALEAYVRDAGGGLLMVGGERSYSAGGYYGTPVEEALPVTMDIRTEVKIPSLAVTILIDKSGSMSTRSGGEEKLAIAKQAAMAALDVLNPLDRVGVLAFDAQFEWTVPVTEVGNRRTVAEQLRSLAAGGGTELVPALSEAIRVMEETTAKVKHLIVLSDGLTDASAELDKWVDQAVARNITISTVAFGLDADQSLMEHIAGRGQGRFYFTSDPHTIPRIFVSETMVVSRGLLVEEPTRALVTYPSEILKGLAADPLPPVLGYQRTYAREAAQVVLSSSRDDPLLVTWRYGLGKSAAFTSDLAGRWGREWVRWPRFGRFAAQLARWTMRSAGGEHMVPTFSWRGRHGQVTVDVLDRDDRYVNRLEVTARMSDPTRTTADIVLEQIAPGRYRGTFPVEAAGRFYFNIVGEGTGGRVGPETFGLAVPYSSEFVDAGLDRELLEDIAAAAGGRMLPLAAGALPTVLADKAEAAQLQWRIWWPFVLLALVAVLLELVVRKMALPERLATLLRFGGGTAGVDPGGVAAEIAAVREAQLAALRAGGVFQPDDPAARARLYMSGRSGH